MSQLGFFFVCLYVLIRYILEVYMRVQRGMDELACSALYPKQDNNNLNYSLATLSLEIQSEILYGLASINDACHYFEDKLYTGIFSCLFFNLRA